MDPALHELVRLGEQADEVSALLRVAPGGESLPPGVRAVARLGDVLSCRMSRGRIAEVRAHEDVVSLKAPRPVGQEPIEELGGAFVEGEAPPRRPLTLRETGRGVVLGVIDFGCDIEHPNFRREDGGTRLLALWDQRRLEGHDTSNPYARGRVHRRADIDAALRSESPLEALGYPLSDYGGRGAHGTHVLDIAAGNGRVGESGLAPEADIVFVHVGGDETHERDSFGDSAAIVEAVHFVLSVAGDQPCVINMSMGRHGGPHDGSTLVEQALDAVLLDRPGTVIVNSAGNYYRRGTHSSGRLRDGERRELGWLVPSSDATRNELEIWYPGSDELLVKLVSPDGEELGALGLGEQRMLSVDGREVGRAYHRAFDPGNGDNHVDIFLDPGAPAGRWVVELSATEVADGRFDAWIERDPGEGDEQSRFAREDEQRQGTIGTIANGRRTIVVGAYDARREDRPVAPFSSAGPTRDGRTKPDLVAPGVGIWAARSDDSSGATGRLSMKSGTSMAAPHVAGTAALMLQAHPRASAVAIRDALMTYADADSEGAAPNRRGAGYLRVEDAVEWARTKGTEEVLEQVVVVDSPERVPVDPSDRVQLSDVNYLAFEGGGGKGFALLGAVRALESLGRLRFSEHRMAGDIRGVAGASAGALTCVAIASGYDSAWLRSRLVPGGPHHVDFNRFMDLPRPLQAPVVGSDCRRVNPATVRGRLVAMIRPMTGAILSPLPAVAATWLSDRVSQAVAEQVVDAVFAVRGAQSRMGLVGKLASEPGPYLLNLLTGYGFFSGCGLRRFFDELIARAAARVRGGSWQSYRHMNFRTHREVFGVDLALTGTNLSTGRSELFSAWTTPRFPVADAARLSMSLPFVYKPMLVDQRAAARFGNGSRSSGTLIADEQLRGYWVDGGVFNNIPIAAFDGRGGEGHTFGIRMSDPDAPERRNIRNLLDYALAYLGSVMMGTGEVRMSQSSGWAHRAVELDVRQLSTFNFAPSRAAIINEERRAYAETHRYFSTRRGP